MRKKLQKSAKKMCVGSMSTHPRLQNGISGTHRLKAYLRKRHSEHYNERHSGLDTESPEVPIAEGSDTVGQDRNDVG